MLPLPYLDVAAGLPSTSRRGSPGERRLAVTTRIAPCSLAAEAYPSPAGGGEDLSFWDMGPSLLMPLKSQLCPPRIQTLITWSRSHTLDFGLLDESSPSTCHGSFPPLGKHKQANHHRGAWTWTSVGLDLKTLLSKTRDASFGSMCMEITPSSEISSQQKLAVPT